MADFPDYERPPVVEVAMGVQFAPLNGLAVAHVGLYWALVREPFGTVEEQAPLGRFQEDLDPKMIPGGPLLEIRTKPDLPRTWFVDSGGNRIIQLQRDRFVHNWRRVREEDEYPRFPNVKESFLKYWREFCEFLKKVGVQSPQVDQCELIYVNLFPRGQGWDSVAELSHVLTTFNWRTRTGFLPDPESFRCALHFLLPGHSGRLRVEMTPVTIPPDNKPALHFALTARGKPEGALDACSMSAWFDLAHEWIVKGFADLVAEPTDRLWGKKT